MKTTEKIEPGKFDGIRPEFGRTADVERYYGLKGGTLYNLCRDGKVRGVTLRVRGQKSGVRLWDMESVHNYIHSEMKKGAKELTAPGPSTKSSDAGSFNGNNKTDVKNETNPPADELPLSSITASKLPPRAAQILLDA